MHIIGKIIGFLIAWVVGSLVFAMGLGSVVWFIGSMFGADWDYFAYIRGWFIGLLVLSMLVSMYNFGIGD